MLNDFEGFKAGGTIAPSVFVKLDTSADQQVVQSTAGSGSHGDISIGVSQVWQRDTPGLTGSNSAQMALSGDMVAILGPGRIAPVTAGGTVTRGDLLKTNASGQVITSSTTADNVVAVALQSGASGNLIKVLVLQPGITHV